MRRTKPVLVTTILKRPTTKATYKREHIIGGLCTEDEFITSMVGAWQQANRDGVGEEVESLRLIYKFPVERDRNGETGPGVGF